MPGTALPRLFLSLRAVKFNLVREIAVLKHTAHREWAACVRACVRAQAHQVVFLKRVKKTDPALPDHRFIAVGFSGQMRENTFDDHGKRRMKN